MRKVPTLFVRDPDDMRRLMRDVHPACAWVPAGEGTPTRKYDGTCVMLDADGGWWARREVKAGKAHPDGFVEVQADPVTHKRVGWEPIAQSSFAKIHAAVMADLLVAEDDLAPGTYELIGPKVNGNPEGVERHQLRCHDEAEVLHDVPRDFEGLRTYLEHFKGEGIVWHHPDGRMAKIKRRDFGW